MRKILVFGSLSLAALLIAGVSTPLFGQSPAGPAAKKAEGSCCPAPAAGVVKELPGKAQGNPGLDGKCCGTCNGGCQEKIAGASCPELTRVLGAEGAAYVARAIQANLVKPVTGGESCSALKAKDGACGGTGSCAENAAAKAPLAKNAAAQAKAPLAKSAAAQAKDGGSDCGPCAKEGCVQGACGTSCGSAGKVAQAAQCNCNQALGDNGFYLRRDGKLFLFCNEKCRDAFLAQAKTTR